MLRRIAAPMGIEFHQCPTYDPEAFANAMKPNTKVLEQIAIPSHMLVACMDRVAHQPAPSGWDMVYDYRSHCLLGYRHPKSRTACQGPRSHLGR